MTSQSEPIGLESGTVRVAPYHSSWPTLFAAEADRIAGAAGAAGITLEVEHTGSTAVPGLAAKPILDILAGLAHAPDRPAAIAALQGIGYEHRGESGIPGRDFFRRGAPRQYHVHLTEIGSAFWHDHRVFRDTLRRHAGVAAAYAALKRGLAEKFPTDREAYIDAKTEFVLRVLAEARRSGEDRR
jgi:GrpB-like predicted nucleotidyltransferase (UPF0157 family)